MEREGPFDPDQNRYNFREPRVKLATFVGPQGRRLGIVKGEALIEVADHLPELTSLEALLEGGPALLEKTRRIAESASLSLSAV